MVFLFFEGAKTAHNAYPCVFHNRGGYGLRAENREIKKFYKSFIFVIFELTNSYYIVDRKKELIKMTYEQLLELSVDLMVKRDRWEWGESDEEFTAQDAQALRHINRIMWDIEDEMMQGHEDDE